MDLDRWAIALPTKSSLLLTPPTSLDSQVLFEEDNLREHDKWALAFNGVYIVYVCNFINKYNTIFKIFDDVYIYIYI